MDIVDNDHTLIFNVFAFIASWAVLAFALIGIWVLLVEFNIRWNARSAQKADIQIMTTAEELRNDFV